MTEKIKMAMLNFFEQGFQGGVKHRPTNSMKEYRQRMRDIRGTHKVTIKAAREEYEKGFEVGTAAWQTAVNGARKRLDYPAVSYAQQG